MAISIYRETNRSKGFTVSSNEVSNRTDLSICAKALYAYIIMLPDDWKIIKSEIFSHFMEGRDCLNNGFNELIKHGYIKSQKIKEKGRFAGYDYTFYETIDIRKKADLLSNQGELPYTEIPQADIPSTEKPYTEIPASGKPKLLNTYELNTELLTTEKQTTNSYQRKDEKITLQSPSQPVEKTDKKYKEFTAKSRKPKETKPRDEIRDYINERLIEYSKTYINPAKENKNLIRAADGVRIKATAENIDPLDMARYLCDTFVNMHNQGNAYWSELTPSIMLARLENLYSLWKNKPGRPMTTAFRTLNINRGEDLGSSMRII